MNEKGAFLFAVLLLIGIVVLFASTNISLRQMHSNSDRVTVSTTTPHQRYRTSDEMRYILYGVGDGFSLDDQQLVEYIGSHISQQSPRRPRQLSDPNKHDPSQVGQSKFVDRLLSGRRNGFFIECGAADGETLSNSLFFELERNWTGILIEANPNFHSALLEKNRRAYVLRACLSTERRPITVRMRPAGFLGGISDKMPRSRASKTPEVLVNCFPLNTIMASLNVSHVDYLSLDVEGAEIDILRTVDWTRLRIDVITVEYRMLVRGNFRGATLKKLKDLREFFGRIGIYKEVGRLPGGAVHRGLDVVFQRISNNDKSSTFTRLLPSIIATNKSD